MIGGADVSILTRAGNGGLELALRAAKRIWQDAIFENAVTGARYKQHVDIPLDEVREVLIYRNAVAAEGWEALGASPELRGTLIHLLLNAGLLTIVIDDEPTQQIQDYLKTVGDALRQDIFNVPASRRAA